MYTWGTLFFIIVIMPEGSCVYMVWSLEPASPGIVFLESGILGSGCMDGWMDGMNGWMDTPRPTKLLTGVVVVVVVVIVVIEIVAAATKNEWRNSNNR